MSKRSLVEDLEIFTIYEDLLNETLEKLSSTISEIKVEETDCDKNFQKPRKRKFIEDLEEHNIESPAKRRAPVQNIFDTNEAPEVQNKVKVVQIGQDSPQDSPQDSSQDPPNPQINKISTSPIQRNLFKI